MHPLSKVKIAWSPEFAYAIGLLVTDGNLSPDGRHISLSSKDKELLITFKSCIDIDNAITQNYSGSGAFGLRIQFGDVNFYNFLMDIGLMPNKSKVIGQVDVPDRFMFDFLRGHFDGDGTFYSYWDARWKSSFMFYTEFISASKEHISWIRLFLSERLGIQGHITEAGCGSIYQLKYAKGESLKLLPKMYYNAEVVCLSRKREKIRNALVTGMAKLTI